VHELQLLALGVDKICGIGNKKTNKKQRKSRGKAEEKQRKSRGKAEEK
jgi:hypothetical protein